MAKPVRGPLNVTGRDRGEVFSGTQYGDYINGAGGNDRIYGNGGNDTLIGGSGNDFLQANAGDDLVIGGTGSDSVRGSSGTDTLWGGDQFNTAGDGSADYFIFDYASDSVSGPGIDTIMDFHPEEGDVIDVHWTVEAYDLGLTTEPTVRLITDGSAPTNTRQEATLTFMTEGPHAGYTVLNLYLPDNNPDADMTVLILGDHSDSLLGFRGFVYG